MQLRTQERKGLGRIALAIALVIAFLAFAGSATAEPTGKLQFMRNATSSFDSFTSGSTPAQQSWMRSHYERMRGYPPYFNQALSWAPRSEFYIDLYAIYAASRGDGLPDQSTFQQHPDWVLRDSQGKPLYIPWACSNGSCPQYAADFGNPQFQDYWISLVRGILDKGYAGIHIDDVNLEMRVGSGNGDFVRPTDPRTGQPMTDSSWNKYMAEFTERIRSAFPGVQISQNPIWWVPQNDPYVQRSIDSSNVIELERGFNDAGITSGNGTYGFNTFLSHIDWLHARGKSVVYEPYNLDASGREYAVAGYFLMNTGGDMITSDYQADPTNWWAGWETDLGSAQGNRYSWNGLLRRDFSGGVVLLNGPGQSSRTVSLGGSYTLLNGARTDSVTLGPSSGVVLLANSQTTPTTSPEPPSSPTNPEPEPTSSEGPASTPGDPQMPTSPSGPTYEPSNNEPTPESQTSAQSTPVPSATETIVDPVEGTQTVISGRVKHGKRGTVKLSFRRHLTGHWVQAGSCTIPVRTAGGFRCQLEMPEGQYRVKGRYQGSDFARPSSSTMTRFQVMQNSVS